jgi:hypothetical protein
MQHVLVRFNHRQCHHEEGLGDTGCVILNSSYEKSYKCTFKDLLTQLPVHSLEDRDLFIPLPYHHSEVIDDPLKLLNVLVLLPFGHETQGPRAFRNIFGYLGGSNQLLLVGGAPSYLLLESRLVLIQKEFLLLMFQDQLLHIQLHLGVFLDQGLQLIVG